jgi:ABC-type nitrate/sulfonate/bicarbonate transport system substrate-binding protein
MILEARIAVGLRSTTQSVSIIGMQTGEFEAAGLSLKLAKLETAAPTGVAGLQAGDWEFAELGAVPVVQAAMAGSDIVIVASVEPSSALFLMTSARIDAPAALAGGRIGVLSVEGQTGFVAGLAAQRWNIAGDVTLVPMQTYPNIYRALRAGEIEAGVLSADYRFDGEHEARLNTLTDLAQLLQLQGPCVITTRAYIRAHSKTVRRFMAGYVKSIHLFKTQPALVLPLLKRHLGFADPVIEQIYNFYAARFQSIPRPSRPGIARAIEEISGKEKPTAMLQPEAVCDLSFVDEIERSGVVDTL